MAAVWDVVAISAMDENQKLAFEKQLAQLQQRSHDMKSMAVQFRVYADEPKGAKIGGGGATLSIVHRLYMEFDKGLFDLRILLIHAGGYSQRQPNASVLGKLFISTPVENREAHLRPFTLFELKLRSYEPLLRRMQPGIFLAASDTLEYFGHPDDFNANNPWSFSGPGFVAVAHPSGLDVGRQHGVYVLDESAMTLEKRSAIFEASCRRVLQKPSVDTMRREGAVIGKEGECVYTDSAYYISHNVVRTMLDIYAHLTPLDVELDAYGDFLQPLGAEATDDYLQGRAVNALVQNDKLLSARRYLYETLRKVQLKVVVFSKSRFYHLGTFGELLGYFCNEDDQFRKDFDSKNVVFSSIHSQIPPSACVIYSKIGTHSVVSSSSRCLLEYCNFKHGIQFNVNSGRCILSNCVMEQGTVIIPVSIFMMTVPIRAESGTKYVTVFFGIEDDLKAKVDRESLSSNEKQRNLETLGEKVERAVGRFSALKLLEMTKLGKEGDRFDPNYPKSLWHAQLFPAFESMESSFRWSLELVNAAIDPNYDGDPINVATTRLYSMHDVVLAKNIDALVAQRLALEGIICAELTKSGKE